MMQGPKEILDLEAFAAKLGLGAPPELTVLVA